jgi:hypothetical protein
MAMMFSGVCLIPDCCSSAMRAIWFALVGSFDDFNAFNNMLLSYFHKYHYILNPMIMLFWEEKKEARSRSFFLIINRITLTTNLFLQSLDFL